MFLANLTNPRWSAYLFIGALLFTYGLLPLTVHALFFEDPYFVDLAQLSFVSCLFIAVGFNLPIFDGRFNRKALRFSINEKAFHSIVWGVFLLFMVVTFTTANSIPIISAFRGASANDLSLERGDFLKARTGIMSILPYISTIFVSTLLPYSLVKLFIQKSKYRFILTGIFFVFTVSFLQKALFLNIILPLIYAFVRVMKLSARNFIYTVGASVIILYLITMLASGGKSKADTVYSSFEISKFFTAGHHPSGVEQFLLWRSVAVPIFTASDTLVVFDKEFGGQPLLGSTSSLIAAIFSMERINIERHVFAYEFGGWNDIGNANAVFITDAYVNFIWAGVVLFSMFVGQSLRWFWKSKDEAFKSLWMLYCLMLFSSSLIGVMLSTGFLFMFIHALFFRLKSRRLELLENKV